MPQDIFNLQPNDKDKRACMGIWQQTINNFRHRFIAGIIIIIPISITLLVLYFIVKRIHIIFYPILKNALHISTPVLGDIVGMALSVIVALLLVYLVGLLSSSYAIRRVIAFGEYILTRIPIIKVLYLTSKQFMDAITLPQSGALKKIVVIEYPRKGIYGLAFVTGETINHTANERLVQVFLPTTPNPTSGFLLLLKPDEIYDVNLSIDEGIKFIISAGIVKPDHFDLKPYAGISNKPNNKITRNEF